MKNPATTFSLRYSAALRRHLRASNGVLPGPLRSLCRATNGANTRLPLIAQAHMLVLREFLSAASAPAERASIVRRSAPFLSTVLVAVERNDRDVSAAAAITLRRLRSAEAGRHQAEDDRDRSNRDYRRLLADSERTRLQLRRMAHHALAAQEEERKEISRELHDEVAQILTGINVQLTILKQASSLNDANLRLRIAHTQRCVKRSVRVVHRFARNLRPVLLDDLGLEPALRSFIRDLPGRTRLHLTLTVEAGADFSDTAKRTVLFRVAQEALTNVVRHAAAGTVSVHLRKLPRAVELVVTDDGRSFDVARALDAKSHNHLGLLGMQERLEMVGGSLAIDSHAGLGTTVRATVPIHRNRAARHS